MHLSINLSIIYIDYTIFHNLYNMHRIEINANDMNLKHITKIIYLY